MQRHHLAQLFTVTLAGLTACQSLGRSSGAPPAEAMMRSASGSQLGLLTLEQTSAGVRIHGTIAGLPSGEHGIHIHAVGRCDPPAFTSAGGHLNPTGAKHGLNNPAGPHAGDLPAITSDNGPADVDITTARVALDSTSLLDADGSAIVIHAGPDDQMTDPAGNAGARIACGVVERRM